VSDKDMANNSRISATITTAEAAQLLHMHTNTVRRWSDKGVVKSYRIGPRGDRRFILEDIIRLLDELHKNSGSVNKS
jgi:excisionase family DNA binding protein